MSHYTVLVLVDVPEGDDPAATVGRLQTGNRADSWIAGTMAYYDENMLLPAYEKPCDCGEWSGRMAARIAASAVTGLTLEGLRRSFSPGSDPDSVKATKWEAHIKPLIDEEERQFAMMEISPDPECSECHGTGTRMSRYNPNSRWDWYEIGGRWSGMMFEGSNVGLMKDRKPGMYPFATVLPDGHWVERGSMGWWGIVSDEKDEETWHAEQDAIFEKYAECIGILCDCHI